MSLGVNALACPGVDGDFYSSIRPLWAEELLCSLHNSFLPESRKTEPLAPDSRSGGVAAVMAMAGVGAFVSTIPAFAEPGSAPSPLPENGNGVGSSLSAADLGSAVGLIALVSLSFALAAVAMTTLAWMLHAWRSPQHLEATGFADSSSMPTRSFSLLVPARHEEEVLGDTIDTLAQLDHPAFEVVAIIGHDDPGTETVARAAARRHPDLVRVVMDHSVPKNKPKGMNTALPHCRGDIVGVFDAEDEVQPDLLRQVARFIPLGGNTVFARGWWRAHESPGRPSSSVSASAGSLGALTAQEAGESFLSGYVEPDGRVTRRDEGGDTVSEYYFWFRSRLHFHALRGTAEVDQPDYRGDGERRGSASPGQPRPPLVDAQMSACTTATTPPGCRSASQSPAILPTSLSRPV